MTERKPEWLKKRLPSPDSLSRMEVLLRGHSLHTVCESALCPNLGECFHRGTATFLIMGDVCTRNCGFCGVTSGPAGPLDTREPEQRRRRGGDPRAAARGGHVGDTRRPSRRRRRPLRGYPQGDPAPFAAGHGIEVLTPDFLGRRDLVEIVLAERPEVFNHNLETVSRLYAGCGRRRTIGGLSAVLAYAASRAHRAW